MGSESLLIKFLVVNSLYCMVSRLSSNLRFTGWMHQTVLPLNFLFQMEIERIKTRYQENVCIDWGKLTIRSSCLRDSDLSEKLFFLSKTFENNGNFLNLYNWPWGINDDGISLTLTEWEVPWHRANSNYSCCVALSLFQSVNVNFKRDE